MIEILSALRVCKDNPVHGLFNVNFQTFVGEILGFLVRDEVYLNTLFSILIGAVMPDSGKIFLNEREVELTSELYCHQNGIFWVRKQSQLVPKLTLSENICSIGAVQQEGFFL
jgi:ABC-type uncharacterized transport system ATPase subunit